MAHKSPRGINRHSRKTLEMVRCEWCQGETLVDPASLPMNAQGNPDWESTHDCILRPEGEPKKVTVRWRNILAWEAEGRHDVVERLLRQEAE